MIDLLILNGVVISMDKQRRVIEDGAIAVDGGRILEVGLSSELVDKYEARRRIDATRKAIMPGLIDSHAHAGHGLVKTMGGDRHELWYEAVAKLYAHGSTEEFWYAESLLSALERLKCGTTCGVSYFGGGDSIMRTDDPIYGEQHCEAVQQIGIRQLLAVGPGRPPFPRTFTRWHGDEAEQRQVSFADQLATCETLIKSWHKQANGKIHICLAFPTYSAETAGAHLAEVTQQARALRELSRKYGVLFTMDGQRGGTIQFTHEQFELLGPDVFLSHCIDLLPEEIELCAQTDTRIVHNPSAVYSIMGRCPVPELLDAGVTVMLGSDGTAPDRSFDMFRHMVQCMHYHRTHFHDPGILPAGKTLEMVTIDAARGLGLEAEIGSLEAGKRADIILLDLHKPHLYPLNMPVFRAIYFANGADVDTVLVDGEILMEQRQVKTMNEDKVLEIVQRETEAALDRADLRHLLDIPENFWGRSHY